MGASFGAMRELAFKHVGSGTVFSFPQGNGDVFAFTSEVVRVCACLDTPRSHTTYTHHSLFSL